jgi:DnaJ-class molecular chaperone
MGGFTFQSSDGFERFFQNMEFGSSGRGGGFPGGFGGGMGGGGMGDMFGDIMGQFFSGSSQQSSGRRKRSSSSTTGTKSKPTSSRSNTYTSSYPESINLKIDVSLEDLYKGKKKKLKVKDTVEQDGYSEPIPIEKIFEVDIQAGYKSKTRIKYPSTRDFPKEVVFEVNELPHPSFQRIGSDLKWKKKLTSRQVKKGVMVRVPLLDGNELMVDTKEYNVKHGGKATLMVDTKEYNVKHGGKATFKGYGMPIPNSGGKKGSLIVEFEVVD